MIDRLVQILPCRCELLTHLLNEDDYFKAPWQEALHWLQNELDRVRRKC